MRNSGKLSRCLMIAGVLYSSGGCSGDSNARKQKYFESGQQYFQAGKYQEATIQFLNAIQVDTSFAAAHYQLARCYLRQKLLSSAYRELAVTVQLDPKNWQAQLDFAGLLFRSGQFSDARARAASILEDNPTEPGAQLLLATSDGELGNLRLAIDEAQRGVQMASRRLPRSPSLVASKSCAPRSVGLSSSMDEAGRRGAEQRTDSNEEGQV